MINKNLVVLADLLQDSLDSYNIFSHHLELIEPEYFNQLQEKLNNIFLNVIHYENLSEFIDNIQKHKNDLIFSIWHGKDSKNRLSLVPSICEAYNLSYVGADAYAKHLCQNKTLSKEYAKEFGFKTPKYISLSELKNVELIEKLTFPLVVKPNMEGSSVGISNKSLVYSYENAKNQIGFLLKEYNQPVLVEEFIGGQEIFICIVGNKNKIELIGAAEVTVEKELNFFNSNLNSLEIKNKKEKKLIYNPFSNSIKEEIYTMAKNAFQSFDKMEALRIDGKYYNNEFWFIEFSPTPYFSVPSAYNTIFKDKNISLEDGMKIIFENTINSHEHQ